ncbi:MAG TPA: hypothetical protein VEU62_00570 [Bryobacterales bacterium]|nr:hypothetical protein [Bryobacterales bacterium]
MLHITNGESVAIGRTGIGGRVLTWKDVLHEGPTPAGLTLREMSQVRARFVADCGWGSYRKVLHELAARDRTLASFRRHAEVVLWFEHDLFDQLQLIQILDWFGGRKLGATRLSLILVDQYLGRLRPEQLAALFPKRRRVTRAALELAGKAWEAFCSPDPRNIERVLRRETAALPFLKKALRRHLEEFPSSQNGLSRSERQTLEILAQGADIWPRIFVALEKKEEAIFLGDAVFRMYLERLSQCRVPLVTLDGPRVSITRKGWHVLDGATDHVRLNGIDRWLGGVHLSGAEAAWRWDERRKKLASGAPSACGLDLARQHEAAHS